MNYYLYIKALHVIAIISWMAALLYLPRLFVYHVDAKKNGELDETLKIMEHKLLKYIMNPAMIVTLISGITLIYITNALSPGNGVWMHFKLLLLLGIFACHGFMVSYKKQFAVGKNSKSQRFFRIFNEIPAILMVIIVILAILKP